MYKLYLSEFVIIEWDQPRYKLIVILYSSLFIDYYDYTQHNEIMDHSLFMIWGKVGDLQSSDQGSQLF